MVRAAGNGADQGPLPILPDRWADDVDLVEADRLWAAWTHAELGREQVSLARCEAGGWSEAFALLPDESSRSFRPTLAVVQGHIVLVGCARLAEGYRPAGLVVDPNGGMRRFTIPAGGQVFHVAMATRGSTDGRAWLAWEERRGAESRVCAGRIDLEGRIEPHSLPGDARASRRFPALAEADGVAWLAWVEAQPDGRGTIRLLRLDSRAMPEDVAPSPFHQEAPFVAMADTRPAVAWHEAVPAADRPDIIRWIRVAGSEGTGGGLVTAGGPPPFLAPNREAAREDQGWEFPTLAHHQGRWWLAGRSSHGWHVASRTDATSWSDPIAVSGDFWGGRGRRGVLRATEAHGVVFARREPDGIVIDRIAAIGEEQPRAKPGNPSAVHHEPVARPPSVRSTGAPSILFGDLHQHTAHSDGLGSLEDLLYYARAVRNLDFAAVSDHDRFCRRALGPATWDYTRDVVNACNEPGRFVTLAAYEFTGPRHPGPGHKCIYFGDRVPDRVPDKDLSRIFAVLRQFGGIAVPHHVGWTGADMEHHDPLLQPVWEICSVHGCYERDGVPTAFPPREDPRLPGHFVKDALDAGLRFGLIGSTDSHGLLWHHGVSRKRDPFATGLAALPGAEPTRAGILAALRARNCYATTGARIEMAVDLDGAPMGSELPAVTRGTLHVEVRGTAPIARVLLVDRGGETQVAGGPEAGARADIPVGAGPRPWDYYYLRVDQADGESAWSSPIWLG